MTPALHRLATLTALTLLIAAPTAQAYEFNTLSLLNSLAEFKQVAQDLSATLAHKPMAPAEGLGITGFDINLSAGLTGIQSRDLLKRATNNGDVPDSLPTATIRVHKGLPLDFDIGAAYTAIPGTSAAAVSGEVKWSFVSGGTLTPAIAVRAFISRMSGLGDMKMHSHGADISISKGFAMATPYAGVGIVGSKASTDSGQWAKESYTQGRVFAGVNLNLAVLNVGLEADRTGDDTTVGIKLGWRF